MVGYISEASYTEPKANAIKLMVGCISEASYTEPKMVPDAIAYVPYVSFRFLNLMTVLAKARNIPCDLGGAYSPSPYQGRVGGG